MSPVHLASCLATTWRRGRLSPALVAVSLSVHLGVKNWNLTGGQLALEEGGSRRHDARVFFFAGSRPAMPTALHSSEGWVMVRRWSE